MNLTNVTINVSSKAKKTLTPEEQKQNEFMKMSLTKKMEFIYNMLMDHEERISALEPEPTEPVKTYNFTSYSDENRTTQYATGTVETTGVTRKLNEVDYTEVEVTNNTVEGFNGNKYYIVSDAKLSKPAESAEESEYHVYQLYEYDEPNDTLKEANIWVTITE